MNKVVTDGIEPNRNVNAESYAFRVVVVFSRLVGRSALVAAAVPRLEAKVVPDLLLFSAD